MSSKLTSEHLSRRAVVYIRQSTAGQVHENRESQRRQYGLVDRARELGFKHVDVVDDDLGRSSSALKERPGFQRLVAQVCAGNVGAVRRCYSFANTVREKCGSVVARRGDFV